MKAFLALLLGFAVLVGGCSKSEQPNSAAAQEEKPAAAKRPEKPEINMLHIESSMLRDLTITTTQVEARPGGQESMLLGELRVNENAYAEVGAPISSRIVRLLAAPGQVVRRGHALAVLQSVELGKARSQLITARARLALANRALERKRRLGAERIVAQREVQEAEAEAASAEAELRAARSALHALGAAPNPDRETERPEYSLHSPVSGVVIDRNAFVGQMADPAQPLFKVGDISTLWLTVHAFERDAVRIAPGSSARISFPALPGKTFSGKVALVGRHVDPDSRTVDVRIDIRNQDGLLRPGMSATAWVTPGRETMTVHTVPVAALQRVEEVWAVFIPRNESTFEIRKVGRGRDLGGEVEILSGLKPGESIVVDGSFLLKAEAEKAHGAGEHHEHQ
ncbi:MAG TPA: efflux RND transporter periplasmic adaptor subunit [Terriglobales bacterium]|nr:efflux RND transporter periplasmic adaptor subunit [Terriglobales bacterium]